MLTFRSYGIASNDPEAETFITDEGVCFTFHSEEVQNDLGHTLNTTTTGTAGGLWLRMNVEQTEEYFFGPESSAGFKVKGI